MTIFICKDIISHLITSCTTATTQANYECEKAFDGDRFLTNGWAHYGIYPASAVFNFETHVALNAIAFKNAVGRANHHVKDFYIEVKVGETFEAVTGVKTNHGPDINGNRITIWIPLGRY